MTLFSTICIIGGGNMGQAIARGLVESGRYHPEQIRLTRRNKAPLASFAEEGFQIFSSNPAALAGAQAIIIAVEPRHTNVVLNEIAGFLAPDQVVISIVTGASLAQLKASLPSDTPVVRAMPNTAVKIRESMTCITADAESQEALAQTRALFDLLGETVVISEELMTQATVLCACGIAFFLRAIRAASQGGVEIGFHAEDAIKMAAQTAKGAASLLLKSKSHPEQEIDKVTTPRGCTIAGLNEMEHQGFSSAVIRGIKTSTEIAGRLFRPE